MPLIRLIYVSTCSGPLSSDNLTRILYSAERNNKAQNITGMLLFANGNFIQVLEGEADAVRALYQKIARDPRHTDIIMLDESEIDQPVFASWSMGFRNLDGQRPSQLAGFTDFLDRKVPPEEFLRQKDSVADLLYQFAQNNAR